MSQELSTFPEPFLDRRSYDIADRNPAFERRQFTNSHEGLSPDARSTWPAPSTVTSCVTAVASSPTKRCCRW